MGRIPPSPPYSSKPYSKILLIQCYRLAPVMDAFEVPPELEQAAVTHIRQKNSTPDRARSAQEKLRPQEECFFLTSPFIALAAPAGWLYEPETPAEIADRELA